MLSEPVDGRPSRRFDELEQGVNDPAVVLGICRKVKVVSDCRLVIGVEATIGEVVRAEDEGALVAAFEEVNFRVECGPDDRVVKNEYLAVQSKQLLQDFSARST